jgi:hypothetical protein
MIVDGNVVLRWRVKVSGESKSKSKHVGGSDVGKPRGAIDWGRRGVLVNTCNTRDFD